jgi:hypothetical protein
MTKLRSLLVVSFALVGLGGSASADKQTAAPTAPAAPHMPPATPPPATPDTPATPATPEVEMPAGDAAIWMSFFDKLVASVVASEGSCDKLATNVSTVIDANKKAITLARAAKAKNMKLPVDAQTHMVDGVKKMVPTMQKCGQDPKVRAAFAKLDLNRKG